jgi:hypothetical protein
MGKTAQQLELTKAIVTSFTETASAHSITGQFNLGGAQLKSSSVSGSSPIEDVPLIVGFR